MADCVFCKIVAGEVPAEFVYQDNLLVAVEDINPKAPVHVVMFPKKHVENLMQVMETDNYWTGGIQNLAKQLAIKLKIDQAYKVLLNGGKFQEVPHIHYHLMGWPEDVKGGISS